MEEPFLNIKDKLIKLRRQEQKAFAKFSDAKEKLLNIKKEIHKLEELLKPNLS